MALDKNATKESLFGNIKKPGKQDKKQPDQPVNHEHEKEKLGFTPEHQKTITSIEDQPPGAEQIKPKWQTLDKVTVLLSSEQKQRLDGITRKLMKHRANATRGAEKERLTANTLIRALIDIFLELEENFPLEVLISEEDVKAWIQRNLMNFDSFH